MSDFNDYSDFGESYQSIRRRSRLDPEENNLNKEADETIEKTKKRNLKWVYIIIGLVIATVIVLFLVIFIVYKKIPYHTIEIDNKTKDDMQIIVGGFKDNSFDYFSPVPLAAGANLIIKATPSVLLSVSGCLKSDAIGKNNPFTTALIKLAGSGFKETNYIENDNKLKYHLTKNEDSFDSYDISLQAGYNKMLSVSPTGATGYNGGKVPTISTVSPITEAICPKELAGPTSGGYQWCQTPCHADNNSPDCCTAKGACDNNKCQQSWINDYSIFLTACPSCMITNCDNIKNQVQSDGTALTGYLITFT